MIEEKEIWKDVVSRNGIFIGYYEVSNLGRVRSKKRVVQGLHKPKTVHEKIMSIRVNKVGYPVVSLNKNRVAYPLTVHRLVADSFIPNPENKPYVDHINTNRADNNMSNLRWVTPAENANNPISKSRLASIVRTKEVQEKIIATKKERNRKTSPKIVHQFTLEGIYVATYESARDAMRKTGIYSISIREVVRGKKASAGGYIWSETMMPRKYDPYKPKKKKVGQYDKEMNLIKVWDSLGEAAKALSLHDSNISRAIYGRTTKKCCGGIKWRFIE